MIRRSATISIFLCFPGRHKKSTGSWSALRTGTSKIIPEFFRMPTRRLFWRFRWLCWTRTCITRTSRTRWRRNSSCGTTEDNGDLSVSFFFDYTWNLFFFFFSPWTLKLKLFSSQLYHTGLAFFFFFFLQHLCSFTLQFLGRKFFVIFFFWRLLSSSPKLDQDPPKELYSRLYDAIASEEIEFEREGYMFGGAERKGYLKKFSPPRTWTKRYFILKESCLYYFKSSKDDQPYGTPTHPRSLPKQQLHYHYRLTPTYTKQRLHYCYRHQATTALLTPQQQLYYRYRLMPSSNCTTVTDTSNNCTTYTKQQLHYCYRLTYTKQQLHYLHQATAVLPLQTYTKQQLYYRYRLTPSNNCTTVTDLHQATTVLPLQTYTNKSQW